MGYCSRDESLRRAEDEQDGRLGADAEQMAVKGIGLSET